MFFIVRGAVYCFLVYYCLPREQKELTHTILLHPSFFGPRMLQYLESKLYDDVEGTCSGQFGYIIAVVSVLDVGKGMVLPGTGQAEFVTRYRAIVFKPFKGEVVDGVVNNVLKVTLYVRWEVLVSEIRLGIDGFLRGGWTAHGLRFPTGAAAFTLYFTSHLTYLFPAHSSGYEIRP